MAKQKPIMSFTLGAHKFKVYAHPEEDYDEEASAYATTTPTMNEIHLWADYFELPQSRQTQILWHEIIHVVLNAACYDKYHDENLVEVLSVFIHQVLTTWKEH